MDFDQLNTTASEVAALLQPTIEKLTRRRATEHAPVSFNFSRRGAGGGLIEIASIGNDPTLNTDAIRQNETTARVGLPVHWVLAEYPMLLDARDAPHGYNAYDGPTGLMVACTGLSPRQNRGVAEMALALWLTLLSEEVEARITTAQMLGLPNIGDAQGGAPVD